MGFFSCHNVLALKTFGKIFIFVFIIIINATRILGVKNFTGRYSKNKNCKNNKKIGNRRYKKYEKIWVK
jgi:hypothetical protein